VVEPRPSPPVVRRPSGADEVPWLRVRRVLDRVVAAIATIVTAPLVAVISVLVRREDGGPPIIRVPRTGEGGRPFGMWKVRSMRAESASGMASGSSLTNGTDDDRITAIGRRLRAFHLDELPQLWNVVAGDMSLLGPRPETPDFVDMNDRRWQRVLSYPPGIAGPTQLIVGDWEREVISASADSSGYRNVVLPTKLAIDAWYLAAASPATDVLVAGTLLRRFVPGNEAWTLRHRVFAEVTEAAPARAFLRANQLARHVAKDAPRSVGMVARMARILDRQVARRSPELVDRDLSRVGHEWVWEARVDGGIVLYDAVHELAHLLSPEAASVWTRCDGRATVVDIAEDLAERNGIDRQQMLRDVTTVVLQLESAGALVDPGRDQSRLRLPDPVDRRLYATDPPPTFRVATPDPATPAGPVFNALGYRFRVSAGSAFADQVAKVLAPLAADATDDGVALTYELVRSDDRTSVHLSRAGVHLRTAPVADAIDVLVWYIGQHATAVAAGVVLHASAVEDGGRVVLLPGTAGAGKSLVALALVGAGHGYVADDMLGIALPTGLVEPFPTPFQVADSAAEVLRSLVPDLDPLVRTASSTFVDPDDVRAGSRSGGGAAELVVVPAHRPGAGVVVEPLTVAQTLVQLLSSAANLDVVGRAGFDALVALAERVPGYRVEYGDVADARARIDELLQQRTGRDRRS
jgi:lipopolysaccharide/colanic/teichoic acid biosynthesis glycosyltransferase